MTSSEIINDTSDDTIRSLARRLDEYVVTLSEEERAIFEHVFLTALPPLERRRLFPEPNLFSQADLELLKEMNF